MSLPHKFGAVHTEVDGISFASKAEARRYGELKLMERAGKITDLRLQPRFDLKMVRLAGMGGTEIVAVYVADASYTERGVFTVEDTKGMETPLYKLKKKMFEAQYGIKITEIKYGGKR